MKRTLIAMLAALALTVPAAAEDPDAKGELRDGFSLLEQGTRLMLRGLMNELEPALREMEEMIGDLSAYHPPEVLPNGDILIRRRSPLQPESDDPRGARPESLAPEEIEL